MPPCTGPRGRAPATAPPKQPGSGRRLASLICGYVSAACIGLHVLVFFVMRLTLTGASSMAALLPVVGILLTGWIWAILALVALVLASGVPRPVHPRMMGGIALARCVIGLGIVMQLGL